MFYYTYKITNLINEKIYVGVHKTENLEDGYMGSGTVLNHAKTKYGIENFRKDILMFHENESDMFEIEALIVDQTFVDRKDTYNLRLGGFGGWDYTNATMSKSTRQRISKAGGNSVKNSNKPSKAIKRISEVSRKMWASEGHKEYMSQVIKSRIESGNFGFHGKKHSEETKLKLSLTDRTGEKNSQFGKMWIHSLEERKSTRINNNEPIPTGWLKGRKMFK